MGINIFANEDKTEAVIVNDSVLPPQPLAAVLIDDNNGGGIFETVGAFIDWLKPTDVRRLEPSEILAAWKLFIQGEATFYRERRK